VASSVGAEWRPRFTRLLERVGAERCIVLNAQTPGTDRGKNEAYARCNEVVQQQAVDLARLFGERPILVAVVVPAGGQVPRGGTEDAIALWTGHDRGEVVEVNPLAP
jgi:hypothetical protein